MIFNHKNKEYLVLLKRLDKANQYNGSVYYSKDICKNIIPNVKTDRNWVTVNAPGNAFDHSIVFLHENSHPERYDYLREYDDLILVCCIPETIDLVKDIAPAIYLPLSIDTKDLEKYRTEKTKDLAYVGRPMKKALGHFDEKPDLLEGMPREELLKEVAKYKRVYAVGRCALEAKFLDCEIVPYDRRFPDPSIWKVLDNREAADILQKELDSFDNRPH